MSTFDWVMLVAGMALFYTFPMVLIAFCIALTGAARQRALPPAVRRQGWIVLGLYLVVIAAYCASGGTIIPALDWAEEGLLIATVVLVSLFLRRSLTRSLHVTTWLLMAETLLLILFLPLSSWVAAQARRDTAYNTNESAAHATLIKNPDDAAAHSSLAHID